MDDFDRVIEIEFARRDHEAGQHHKAAELLAGADGDSRIPGRQAWQPGGMDAMARAHGATPPQGDVADAGKS